MLNDRDDKYEGQEDSEYQFSDEEVNYDAEEASTRPAESTSVKESFLNRLNRSKRMIISLVVFIVLIFIVYKMVTPTQTTAPSTDITPQPAVSQMPPSLQPPTQAPPSYPPSVQAPPQTPVATVQQAPTQPVMPSTAYPPQATAPVQEPVQQTIQQMPSTPTAPPTVVSQTPPPTATPPFASGAPAQPPMVQQPPPQQQPSPPPVAGMPAVIPVQSAVVSPYGPVAAPQPSTTLPSATPPVTDVSGPAPVVTVVAPQPSAIITPPPADVSAAGQLQAEYMQRVNEFSEQNKALQDQIQTLSARVVNIENQMNQLVQVLMRQNQPQQSNPSPANVVGDMPQSTYQPKIPYNVQAIIPGRAWLRADNGETVTVTEGDVIKDVGRVTKINPYDGVVDINTGNRVISLSYGNTDS